jgi:hypothetical protein
MSADGERLIEWQRISLTDFNPNLINSSLWTSPKMTPVCAWKLGLVVYLSYSLHSQHSPPPPPPPPSPSPSPSQRHPSTLTTPDGWQVEIAVKDSSDWEAEHSAGTRIRAYDSGLLAVARFGRQGSEPRVARKWRSCRRERKNYLSLH